MREIWQLRRAVCKRAYKPQSTLNDNAHRVHSLSVLLTHRARRILASATRTACNDFPRTHPRRLALTRRIGNHAASHFPGPIVFFQVDHPPKEQACTKPPTSAMEATATLLDLIALTNRCSANSSHRAYPSPSLKSPRAPRFLHIWSPLVSPCP